MRQIIAILVVAIGLGLSASKAQAQIPVTDAGAIAEFIEQVLVSYEQLDNLKKTLEQDKATYDQMVNNAKGLGELQSLLSAYNIDSSQLTQKQLSSLLNDIYALDQSSPTWYSDVSANLRRQGYTVPVTQGEISAQANGVFDPAAADKYVQGYNKQIADYQSYSQQANLMTGARKQMLESTTNMDTFAAAVNTLGDDNMGASLQTMNVGVLLLAQQLDTNSQLGTIQADAAMQQHLQAVQRETETQNEIMATAQAQKTYISTPRTIVTGGSVQ